MIHRASSIALFLALLATAAFAGSYILPSEEELVRRADAIGTFTVTSANSYYGADGLIYTRYSLATRERIKGELGADSTYLVEMGGVVGSRMFSVSTSPHYAPGERVLVFLARRGETWATLDGQMGKFSFARRGDGSEVLGRDQDVFPILPQGTGHRTLESPTTLESAATMLARIRRLTAETRDEPVRQVAISPMLVKPDDAAAVNAFNTARAAWNGDAGSNINIGNGGTVASIVYGTSNNENVVHFGVPSSFCYGNPPNCPLTGNVVGQAQVWATSAKNTLRGEEFYTADECDVVVEAGLTGNALNEVTAHELGHCLGYRHSNQGTPNTSNALMNSSVSGVGANLRAWDRDAANVVYGDGSAAAPGVTGNSYLTQFGFAIPGGARWPTGGFTMKVQGDVASSCSTPAITTQPQNRSISSGQTATLSVAASGAGLSFQWYSGGPPSTGSAIPNATAASFTTPALTSTQTYSVRVSNSCGSVDSSVATVSVGCAVPTITTQPQNRSIPTGQTATLFVAASGAGPLTYQWFSGGTPSSGTLIPGATSATFTTPPLSVTQTYSVRVTNSCGSASSNIAIVSVENCTQPAITANPVSTTIDSGQSASLTVIASGTLPRTIQWYRGLSGNLSTPIAGAVSATLNTGPLTATSQFWAQVTNSCGSANSNTATVTVRSACTSPVITTPPQSVAILSGSQATLQVVATGTSLQFQWYRGETGDLANPVAGATGSAFTTPPLTSNQRYWVQVFNSCGTLNSASARVSMKRVRAVRRGRG